MAEEPTAATIENRLSDDFTEAYANNARFELTTWDLKMFFGQLAQFPEEKSYVDWHTAITMPWLQVKILSYFLQINLAAYESQNGKLQIPPNILPPPPPAPPTELKDNSVAKAMHEASLRFYAELTGEAKTS